MIALGSDNTVVLLALTSQVTHTLVADATVTGQLLLNNINVYSFGLTYTGSNGTYTGLIPAATAATLENANYIIKLTAVASEGTVILVSNQVAQYLPA